MEDETAGQAKRVRRSRTKAALAAASTEDDDVASVDSKKPPLQSAATRQRRAGKRPLGNTNVVSTTPALLEGLEEDIVEVAGESGSTSAAKSSAAAAQSASADQSSSSTTDMQAQLLAGESKSVPTDAFYLELEKKFAMQSKQLFEKRERERLAQLFDEQLRLKRRDELRYQISTPRTALKTHAFLRCLFLFVHGLNVGFQFWQIVTFYTLNLDHMTLTYNYTSDQARYVDAMKLASLYKNISLPIHCISYFFLTICIVDAMDRLVLFEQRKFVP